jgi:hypothetical protein
VTYVADGVLCDIDAVFEDALSTRLAGSWCASGSNNLVWGRLDVVFCVEVEEVLILLPVVVLPLVLPVLIAVLVVLVWIVLVGIVLFWAIVWLVVVCWSSYSNGSAEDSEHSRCGEMHVERLSVLHKIVR